jgi:acetyl-CoA carboxylase carboxyl transferase subunit alpha
MMENSVYSVISPEGCASIMWRDATKREIAAAAMKITARDMLELKLVDGIVPEPDGGAHNNHERAAELLKETLSKYLAQLKALSVDKLLEERYDKFRHMGQYFQVQ